MLEDLHGILETYDAVLANLVSLGHCYNKGLVKEKKKNEEQYGVS